METHIAILSKSSRGLLLAELKVRFGITKEMTETSMKYICISLAVLSAQVVKSQADDKCQLKGYNLLPLTKSFWAVPISAPQCQNTSTDCAVFFSLCHKDTICPVTASACVQQSGISSKLGEDGNIKEKPDGSGFNLTYTNRFSSNATNRTVIEFVCDHDIAINTNIDTFYSGKFKPQIAIRLDDGYHIVIHCDIGCKQRNPIGIGAQLMIILMVLFALYFFGGMIHNHINGARGEELIPHYWFWKNFPYYVVDGCIFVGRLITCQAKSNYSRNPDYGATSPAGVSPTGRTYEAL